MSITKKVHKISLVVDANTKQLRNVNAQFQDLEREIARVTAKVDTMGTHFKASEKRATNAVNRTAKASKVAHTSMGNDVVRHIRRLESLVVAFYAVKKAYDTTLGRGHEFNKLIETETVGLKLLISQNLAHADSLGRLLTPMEKFQLAQKEADKAIKIARNVNIETPHSFAETMQIFKLLTPQVLKYNGTLEDTGKITKNVSIIASAMGVEFQQLLKTVDSAMSGEAKESGLKRAFAQFGITNELIKSTIESGGSVVDLFIKKLENADVAGIELAQTWQGVTSKFINIWDEIFGAVQKPLFESMKHEIAGIALYLKTNSKEIIENLHTIGTVAIEVGKAFAVWKISSTLMDKFKALQFGMARTAVLARQSNGLFTAMDLRLMKLGDTFKRVGRAMKSMFVANLPLMGMLGLYETWNYLSGQIADKEERLNKILSMKAQELSKLTDAQQKDTLNKLQDELITQRKIVYEKNFELRLAGRKLGKTNEEYIALKATYDTEVQKQKEMVKQEKTLLSILDGTYKAGDAVYNVADGAKKTADELQEASEKAFNLANNLNGAVSQMNIELIKAKELAGDISKTQSVKLIAGESLKEVEAQMGEINKLYGVQGASIDELNAKAIKAYTKELSVKNRLKEQLEDISDKQEKGSTKATNLINKEIKDADRLYRSYLELTDQKEKLFQFDVDKKLGEFFDAGYSMEQLSKAYDGMWKKYVDEGKKANKKHAMDFTNQFKGLLEGIFDGDFGGALKGFFDGVGTEMLADPIKNISESMSSGISSMLGGLGAMGGVVGGIAMSGIGMLVDSFFGDEEEPAPELGEIRDTSESMANALDYMKDAQYPMLQLTREMTGYLKTISLAFGGIENSLIRSGIDIGGSLFQDTYKKGTLFGGKSTSLYGTSINVEAGSMAELMDGQITAFLDTVTKTVKTKWYGAKKTSYNHKYTDISNDIGDYVAEATTAVFESLALSGEALGIDLTYEEEVTKWVADTEKNTSTGLFGAFGSFFDRLRTSGGFFSMFSRFGKNVADATGEWVTETVSHSLADEIIDIGKFDTTGMSADEVAEEIQGRFSAQLDLITEKYFGVVSEFQKAGEGLGETLFRVITNFEQVSHSMELIGKSVDWRTANIITDVAGGLDSLNASMGSYTENFFTDAEKYDMKLNTMTKSFASLGLSLPSSNAEFRSLVDGIDTTTDAGATLFAEVISLADGFAEMTSSASSLGVSIKDMVSSIADAWMGNLSYLTMAQKAEYASGYFEIARQSDGELDVVESARAMAETALRSTSTKEEYIPIFNEYIKTLEEQAPQATTDDVVAELRALRAEVQILEETTRRTA